MSASSSSATPPSSASKKQAEVAPSQIVVSYWTAVGSVTHILTFSSVHNIPPPCRVTIDDLSGALHSLLSKDVFIAYRDAGISSELAKHVEAFDKPSVQALSVRISLDNSVAFVNSFFGSTSFLLTRKPSIPLPPPPPSGHEVGNPGFRYQRHVWAKARSQQGTRPCRVPPQSVRGRFTPHRSPSRIRGCQRLRRRRSIIYVAWELAVGNIKSPTEPIIESRAVSPSSAKSESYAGF